MKRLSFLFLFIFFSGVLLNAPLNVPLSSASRPPQFLVSWRANSYTPSWYTGKTFPTRGSEVSVRFSLIDGRGRNMDVSALQVRWYVNRILVANEETGLGINSLKFTVTDFPGRNAEVRITVLNLGEGGLPIDKIIRIPVIQPYVGISSSLEDTSMPAGATAKFTANPFFFNVKNPNTLAVQWESNGVRASSVEDPWTLNFSTDPAIPTDTRLLLGVTVLNPLNNREFAGNRIDLKIQ